MPSFASGVERSCAIHLEVTGIASSNVSGATERMSSLALATACGPKLTEAQARASHATVDIYKTGFRPMKHTLSGRDGRMLMKLVVDGESDRVLGCHVMGESAAEMIQCVAIAVKMKATKRDFDATVALAEQANLTFAQFVLLTPFPGTIDFDKWAAEENRRGTRVEGMPITQHWLIPQERRPRLYADHPTMSLEEIRVGTQHAWDRFYGWAQVWRRSRVVESLRARLAFVLISKLYRQMYAGTGIATDSARVRRSAR